MPENVKLHPHENCNCDRDGVALPPEIVLEVKNLTKKFQVDGGKVLTACDKVNLNAYKGQTLGIIGESGCGKKYFGQNYFTDPSGYRGRSNI